MNLNANDKNRLMTLITDLEEESTLNLIQKLMADGTDRLELLDACLAGLNAVGGKYENGHYYVAALVMAGEMMGRILEVIKIQGLEESGGRRMVEGSVLIGTIEGDIHDLGKDLVKGVLHTSGFMVYDLGVDVAPEMFMAEAIKRQPDLVGISILLNTSRYALKRTVELLKTMMPAGQKRPRVIIGGGAVCQEFFGLCGADAWCRDIMKITSQCSQLISRED